MFIKTSTVLVCLIRFALITLTTLVTGCTLQKDSLVMNEKLVFGSFQLRKGETEKVEGCLAPWVQGKLPTLKIDHHGLHGFTVSFWLIHVTDMSCMNKCCFS